MTTVSYPRYGLSFAQPPDWQGQETPHGYVMGSAVHPGMLVASLHEHRNLATLQQQAQAGIGDGATFQLMPAGGFEPVGEAGLGGIFEGMFSGDFARAYVVGLIHPHGGPGVLIVAVTTPDAFAPLHRDAVLALAASLRFDPPGQGALHDGWTRALAGSRLLHLSSASAPSGGGFASSRTELDLLADGRFRLAARSQASMGVAGLSGHSRGADGASGRWRVETAGGAESEGAEGVLVLGHDDGRHTEYRLAPGAEAGEVLLDGARWFLQRGVAAG